MISNRTLKRDQDESEKARTQPWYASEILYKVGSDQNILLLSVSGTEFGRNMSRIMRGAKDVRTITFPSTVRGALDGAFADTNFLSAVLNEGLETFGEYRTYYSEGIFRNTKLRQVALPSTLRVLGDRTFYECESLREITFEKESRLKCIGK